MDIILTSYVLVSGKNFNMCIVNIKRFYAANKNKVSIRIWPLTIAIRFNSVENELIIASSPRVKHVIIKTTRLVTIVPSSSVLRRENSYSCEISHFPASKQTVKVQFSPDVLGKIFSNIRQLLICL